jgi:hypothetical protein
MNALYFVVKDITISTTKEHKGYHKEPQRNNFMISVKKRIMNKECRFKIIEVCKFSE